MSQALPAVSATIVLYNSERGLEDCLRSLTPELDEGFAELIAVDNSSPDRSAQLIRDLVPAATVIESSKNVGFAGGANLAWQSARGRYWLLLNPDARLAPGALRRLVEWMDAHPRLGVASAELQAAEDGGTGHITGRALPSLWRPLLEVTRLHRLLPANLRGRLLRGPYWTGGDQTDAGWVPGTALMARREAVEEVGILDDRFFLYGEDIEWCWRMKRHDWGIGVCSTARVAHDESSSAGATFTRDDLRERMARGEVRAVAVRRGALYARIYAWLTALALRTEAVHPFRSTEAKQAALTAARAWTSAAREASR